MDQDTLIKELSATVTPGGSMDWRHTYITVRADVLNELLRLAGLPYEVEHREPRHSRLPRLNKIPTPAPTPLFSLRTLYNVWNKVVEWFHVCRMFRLTSLNEKHQ
jgi:hypothetical protein